MLDALHVLVGLSMLVGGIWTVRRSREKVREKRRLSRLIAGAITLDAPAKAGDILCVEGSVVGEQAAEGAGPQDRDHLIIEDERGRRVCLEIPDQSEVIGMHRAGQRVFAVGEVKKTAADPYRSQDEITLTSGEAGNVKTWRGDRSAALRDLQAGYAQDLGGGLFLMFLGLVVILLGTKGAG